MNVIKPILLGTLAASIIASTGCTANMPSDRYAPNRVRSGRSVTRNVFDGGSAHLGRDGRIAGPYNFGGGVPRGGFVHRDGRTTVRDGFDGHMNRRARLDGHANRDGRIDGHTNRHYDGRNTTIRDGRDGNVNRHHDGRNATIRDGRDGNVNRHHDGRNTTARDGNMARNQGNHLGRDGKIATQKPSL